MRHAQMFFNRKTGQITVEPGWPPLPSEGDHWVKPASKRPFDRSKRLERKVIEVRGWRLKYEDQKGKVRECSTDAFHKWTDDCRAVPVKLRAYVIKQVTCPDCEGKKTIDSYSGKKIVGCWRCNETGKIPGIRPKKRPPPQHKDAYRWRKKVNA